MEDDLNNFCDNCGEELYFDEGICDSCLEEEDYEQDYADVEVMLSKVKSFIGDLIKKEPKHIQHMFWESMKDYSADF